MLLVVNRKVTDLVTDFVLRLQIFKVERLQILHGNRLVTDLFSKSVTVLKP